MKKSEFIFILAYPCGNQQMPFPQQIRKHNIV